jgi:hypothetical protein
VRGARSSHTQLGGRVRIDAVMVREHRERLAVDALPLIAANLRASFCDRRHRFFWARFAIMAAARSVIAMA